MTCGNNVTHRSYPTMALCNQNLYRPSVQSFRALTRRPWRFDRACLHTDLQCDDLFESCKDRVQGLVYWLFYWFYSHSSEKRWRRKILEEIRRPMKGLYKNQVCLFIVNVQFEAVNVSRSCTCFRAILGLGQSF